MLCSCYWSLVLHQWTSTRVKNELGRDLEKGGSSTAEHCLEAGALKCILLTLLQNAFQPLLPKTAHSASHWFWGKKQSISSTNIVKLIVWRGVRNWSSKQVTEHSFQLDTRSPFPWCLELTPTSSLHITPPQPQKAYQTVLEQKFPTGYSLQGQALFWHSTYLRS